MCYLHGSLQSTEDSIHELVDVSRCNMLKVTALASFVNCYLLKSEDDNHRRPM